MENREINIGVVAEVAEALQELREDMIFVGGAVISIYANDPAADEIRPTQDIDMALNIVSLHQWEQLQNKLQKLGFYPDSAGHSICSYKYKNIAVDIMSMEDGPLGSTNRWYKIGYNNAWLTQAKNQTIKVLSAPCYLATKFEAFNSRGNDYRTSHDVEDIIYVIDNRIEIIEEIEADEVSVRQFLRQQLSIIKKQGLLLEILAAHIHPLIQEERIPILEEKINQILQSQSE